MFKHNDMVKCIAPCDKRTGQGFGETLPVVGVTYRVRSSFDATRYNGNYGQFIRLYEIRNESHGYDEGLVECGFWHGNFELAA